MRGCRSRVDRSAILALLLLLCNISYTAFVMMMSQPVPLEYPEKAANDLASSFVPLTYPGLSSNVQLTVEQPRLTETPQGSMRAFLLFYEGIPNYEALIAWVEFHRKRWGVTHVDVFVKERLSEMRATLNQAFKDSIKFEVTYTHYHRDIVPRGLEGRIAQMLNVVLHNAKRDNNTYVLSSDPDEFLISEDFRDVEEMFAGGHDAVSFPLFYCNYHVCSDNALNFGSLKYQFFVPFGSNYTNNASLDYYTEPRVSCQGQRKFIVRTEKWDHLDNMHDPFICSGGPRANLPSERRRRVLYFTGRRQDGEHARLLHLRTGRGLHADLAMDACSKVASCNFVTFFGECVNGREGARLELKDTELTQLMKDHPLFPDASQVSLDAVCYAERHTFLLKVFCEDDVKKCRYGALYRHYHDYGRKHNLTWGCKM